MNDRFRAWCVLGLACVANGCAPDVSDTGFEGKWVRESPNGTRSVISIAREVGEYTFLVNRVNPDGSPSLRCPRAGTCTIYTAGAAALELDVRVLPSDEEGAFLVEWKGTPVRDRSTPIEWVDRVSVHPGGVELWISRVELNGMPRNEWPRVFRKLDDNP